MRAHTPTHAPAPLSQVLPLQPAALLLLLAAGCWGVWRVVRPRDLLRRGMARAGKFLSLLGGWHSLALQAHSPGGLQQHLSQFTWSWQSGGQQQQQHPRAQEEQRAQAGADKDRDKLAAILQSLPLEVYEGGHGGAGDDSSADRGGSTSVACSVCCTDYVAGTDVLRVLPCCHRFHIECVDRWFWSGSRSCPMCNHRLM